jgi:hypothetical protein
VADHHGGRRGGQPPAFIAQRGSSGPIWSSQLQLQITGTIPGNDTATSASVVGVAAPPAADPVTITGKLAADGSLAVAAPLALGATREFQWLRDGAPIGGATDSTYDPLDSDVGHLLEVQATESVDGYDPVSVTSAPQSVSGGGTALPVPTLTPEPTVRVAVQAEIAAEEAAHQWLLDGAGINGATEATLVVPSACAGKQVSLQVTAERIGYITREMISDAVKIGYGTIKSSMPWIEGDPRVDQTVHVIKGEWSAQAEFHYQWIVGGIARDGRSTGPAYKVRPEDRGQGLTVEVTGRMDGCEPVVRSSAATEPVRRA